MTTSIHLEPAYGQFYTQYDQSGIQSNTQPPEGVTAPAAGADTSAPYQEQQQPQQQQQQQYNLDTPNAHKISLREIESSYQYTTGYSQPIQQPLHNHYSNSLQNTKSPYHINPAYDPADHPPSYAAAMDNPAGTVFGPITASLYQPQPISTAQHSDRTDGILTLYQDEPRTYMRLAIAVCFINPFFGIIAVLYAVHSKKSFRRYRIKQAKLYGRMALFNSLLGVGLTIVGVTIFLLVFADRL